MSSIPSRSPSPGLNISLFTLTNEHNQHVDSPKLIYIESDGRIFCPECLDITLAQELDKIDEHRFGLYVVHLFEALDQHGDREQLRAIVLPTLEIILKHKKLKINNDDDYHDLSRVIYKNIKVQESDIEEFSCLARIFLGLSVESVRPIPLKTSWNACKLFLDRGEMMIPTLPADQGFTESYTRLISALFAIVRDYLSLVNSHVDNQVSDLIFSIMIRDTQDVMSQKYYIESQIRCLEITKRILVPCCHYHLINSDKLVELEKTLLQEIFDSLTESLRAAIRLADADFILWLKEQDYIFKIHSILYKNPTIGCRSKMNRFLKYLILYGLEEEYGSEIEVAQYIMNDSDVQTSARHVRSVDQYDEKFRVYGLYVLLNYVAIKHNSNYVNLNRIRGVLADDSTIANQVRESFRSSMTIMRAFTFVTAVVTDDPCGDFAAKKFIKQCWKDMHKDNERYRFHRIFCFDEVVFRWAHQHQGFCRMIESDSLKYCVRHSSKRGNLSSYISIMLMGGYRNLIRRQISADHKVIFREFIKLEPGQVDSRLMNDLAALLSTMLHETILRSLNDRIDSDNCSQAQQEMSALNLLLQRFDKFIPYFDDRFVADLCRYLEQLYQTPSLQSQRSGILIAVHNLMANLLRTNHSCTNKLVQYIDFTLLGYMYNYLEHRTASPEFIESVAELLIVYDDLDYPYLHRLDQSFYLMLESVMQWTLSRSNALHSLALKLCRKIFLDHDNRSRLNDRQRCCLTTGFVQMIFNDAETLVSNNKHTIMSILDLEEFRYHSLTKYLMIRVPALDQSEDTSQIHNDVQQDFSFGSTDDEVESHDQMSITHILDQIPDDMPSSRNTTTAPEGMYFSRSLSQHDAQVSNSNSTQDWEKRAYETSQAHHVI